MMQCKTGSIICIVIMSSLVLVAGCKEAASPEPPVSVQASTVVALPADLFATEAIDGARSVADIKANAKAAEEIIVEGRVGGRKDVFVDGVAMFLLADTGMKSCAELHADKCPTPWDYCCEPEESLNARVATVQIVGADGKPLRTDIKGKHGINPLARVTIAGTIASRDAGSLVINATKIYVPSTG